MVFEVWDVNSRSLVVELGGVRVRQWIGTSEGGAEAATMSYTSEARCSVCGEQVLVSCACFPDGPAGVDCETEALIAPKPCGRTAADGLADCVDILNRWRTQVLRQADALEASARKLGHPKVRDILRGHAAALRTAVEYPEP